MSALDDILNVVTDRLWNYDDARGELAQLRADLQAAQERSEALENDIICAFCGAHYNADDVPPQHYLTCEASPLVQRIAEQARQLDAARVFAEYVSRRALWTESTLSHSAAIWLAANPAPEAEPMP